jgi:hypothetical protein
MEWELLWLVREMRGFHYCGNSRPSVARPRNLHSEARRKAHSFECVLAYFRNSR